MFALIKRAFNAWTIGRYLNISLTCEATGTKFNLLDLLEQILDFGEAPKLEELEKNEAVLKLVEVSKKRISIEKATEIINNFTLFALIFYIWKKYGILNPSLTFILLSFYCSDSKETAEQLAAVYCMDYLEQTINPVLSIQDKFYVTISDSKPDESVKLKIQNRDYGFEINTPKLMPEIVSDISEKYIGLN